MPEMQRSQRLPEDFIHPTFFSTYQVSDQGKRKSEGSTCKYSGYGVWRRPQVPFLCLCGLMSPAHISFWDANHPSGFQDHSGQLPVFYCQYLTLCVQREWGSQQL